MPEEMIHPEAADLCIVHGHMGNLIFCPCIFARRIALEEEVGDILATAAKRHLRLNSINGELCVEARCEISVTPLDNFVASIPKDYKVNLTRLNTPLCHRLQACGSNGAPSILGY